MTDSMAPPRYEPFGWHHWPGHFWMSYQFRRGLGETQEGGGAVSEVFQAASRMKPGDAESWHEEWSRIAVRADGRGDAEFASGHVRTAMNCWLRAANYFREAEFWLKPDDPRRLATFDRCETASRKWLARLAPSGEIVDIPYLILHGGHDVLGVNEVTTVHDYAVRHGVKATLRLTSAEETGAEHCQHDNPTLGQELMLDWLADVFRIDQRNLPMVVA